MSTAYIRKDLQEWSNILFDEINNDPSDYFWPKSNHHKIFDQAYMKFVNRNLNYFNYENMIITALYEQPEWHPGLPKTLEFCNFVKTITGQDDMPFGRMCVWKIPPKLCIMPHVDNFIYHSMITRYIFIVSKHNPEHLKIIIANEKKDTEQGVLFSFFPAIQRHEFNNYSDNDFYFLGFDIYKKDILHKFANYEKLELLQNDPNRLTQMGAAGTTCKYISLH